MLETEVEQVNNEARGGSDELRRLGDIRRCPKTWIFLLHKTRTWGKGCGFQMPLKILLTRYFIHTTVNIARSSSDTRQNEGQKSSSMISAPFLS